MRLCEAKARSGSRVRVFIAMEAKAIFETEQVRDILRDVWVQLLPEFFLRSIIVCGGVFSRVMFAINCMSLRCQGCAYPVPLEAKRDTDGKQMGFGRGKSATSNAGKQLTG